MRFWPRSLPLVPEASACPRKWGHGLLARQEPLPYQGYCFPGGRDFALFQELELERRHVEMGLVPREREINGENARELALFSLKKSRERKEGKKTTPNNNFPNKTHIIIKKSIIGIQ